MSLLMLRNGVLSADRRVMQLNGEYDAMDQNPKLYMSPDKRILIGSVGSVLSVEECEVLHNGVERVYAEAKKGDDWAEPLVNSAEVKKALKHGATTYIFFANSFLVIKKDDSSDRFAIEVGDINKPHCSGSGMYSAYMLLRAERDGTRTFSLQQFYRIIAASVEGVSPVIDSYPINTLVGFKK